MINSVKHLLKYFKCPCLHRGFFIWLKDYSISLVKTIWILPKLEKHSGLYIFPLVLSLLIPGCVRRAPYLEIHGNTMGTTYSIKIVQDKDIDWNLNQTKRKVDSILREVNRQMSTFIYESEISQFNRSGVGVKTAISPGFTEVLQRARLWGEITEGALDVTIMPLLELWGFGPAGGFYFDGWEPPRPEEIRYGLEKVDLTGFDLDNGSLTKIKAGLALDLGAIAKGWGVDVIYAYLREQGSMNFMVEIGGEVRTWGKNIREEDWSIGIDKPEKGFIPGQQLTAVVFLTDQAMATSGDYRNYFEFEGKSYAHIIDPRTGYPAESGIASVTVVGPNCTDVDGLATALMVMHPEKGRELVESLDGYEAYWILREGKDLKSASSSGFQFLDH